MAASTAELGMELRFRLQKNSRQFNIEIHKEKEMLALRKLLPVLAVIALFAAMPASATDAFTCQGTAGAPPLIRAEGLAEYVGDLLLTCSGGDPTAPLAVNIRVLIGQTTITSNILSGNVTEAVLAIDEPQDPAVFDATKPYPAQCATLAGCTGGVYGAMTKQNLWLGSKAANNQVEWLGIPIIPPGTTGSRIIRVTNIRVDATQVPTSTYVAGTVSEYISITGTAPVPVSPQPQTVAFVVPSISVTATAQNYKQCTSAANFPSITFTELFASAFRKKIETKYSIALGVQTKDQSTLGGSYITESGFSNPALLGNAGVATNGTRFIIRLKNINNGVAIAVPGSVLSSATDTNGQKLVAKFVSGAASDGSGGTVDAAGGTLTQTSNSAYAVYEVTGDANATYGPGPNGYAVTDSFAISLTPSWTTSIGTGIPGLGSATINGNYAPINTVNVMSGPDPEPRFKDSATDTTVITVAACRTIILFPFLTNQATFDAGVAIINTSKDPWSGTGTNQSGACTLYYYGDAAPSAVTTPALNAGEHLAFTLSGGGNVIGRPTATVAGAPGFQGYMFAICLFQYAHGYAFITKQGATDIAHGYIALIVPDRGSAVRVPQNAATIGNDAYFANQGEQLAF
jgi:hypothetical protein